MKRKALFMETTMIEAAKTVAEIQTVLGRYGANAIMTEYESGDVSAVSFRVNIGGRNVPFRLPCRWEKILEHLYTVKFDPAKHNVQKCPDAVNKSKRVAWRQILRWIQAQLALTETNMVSIQEVFLPYMQTGVNQTLYQMLEENKFAFKQLEHSA